MDSFSDMGADTITVSLMGNGSKQLTDTQMYEFVDEHPESFLALSPTTSLTASVRRGEKSIKNETVTGESESCADIKALKLTSGRFLAYADMISRSKVCVIGTYVWEELFDGEDPVGQTIKIGADSYEVIGLLEEKGDSAK